MTTYANKELTQRQVPNMHLDVSAVTTLTPYQRRVRCLANTATDSYTVTLPPASEAAGLIITIRAVIANSKAVTVAHAGDSQGWSNLTLGTDGDHVALYCDGISWYVIFNGIA